MTRSATRSAGRGVAALAAVVAAVAAAWWGVRSRAPRQPNVLIVLWDTVRADRLTPYDERRATTPSLARWAEQSVVFEHAVSPGMWTVPSHASMFTGVPPTTHGTGMDHLWLDDRHLTMAEWFGSHGYDTYAFSANPNLSTRRVNLLQGFTTVDVSWQGKWSRVALQNARSKLIPEDASTEISPSYVGPAPPPLEPQSAFWDAGPAAQQAFVAWLDHRDDDRPFFAYLSYMEAHKPRIPSLAARRAVAENPDLERQLGTDLSFDNQLLYSYGRRDYTREELAAIKQVYDAALWDLDRTTTALFADLEQRGLLDDTIVVFTSDHGEQLGEHHLFGHRNGVYQTLLHVPLVITWRGTLEPRRVKGPVSTMDLFDTLVAAAGLPAPDGVRSGGDLLRSKPGIWGVFTESLDRDTPGFERVRHLSPDLVDNPWDRQFRAMFDGRWKLIEASDGETRLFDVHADPHEREDLTAAQPQRVAELTERLHALSASLPPYDPAGASASDVPAADDAAMKAYLGALGYVDEEAVAAPE